MITAIRLDPTAVGIHGVDFRNGLSTERICGFEQDAAVAENIRWQEIRRAIRQGQRISASQAHGLDHKSLCGSSRVHHAIFGQIKRPNAVFVAGGDAARLSATQSNLPDLPGVFWFAFA